MTIKIMTPIMHNIKVMEIYFQPIVSRKYYCTTVLFNYLVMKCFLLEICFIILGKTFFHILSSC